MIHSRLVDEFNMHSFINGICSSLCGMSNARPVFEISFFIPRAIEVVVTRSPFVAF
jgi:hypothetical protein